MRARPALSKQHGCSRHTLADIVKRLVFPVFLFCLAILCCSRKAHRPRVRASVSPQAVALGVLPLSAPTTSRKNHRKPTSRDDAYPRPGPELAQPDQDRSRGSTTAWRPVAHSALALMMRSKPSSSMQKTYDECYLICSTAVYFEGQVRRLPHPYGSTPLAPSFRGVPIEFQYKSLLADILFSSPIF